jgi:hypothetical protein
MPAPSNPEPPPPGARPSDDRSPHPRVGPVGQPQSIRAAVMLMYVGAGLVLFDIFMALVVFDMFRDQVSEDNPSYNQDRLDSAVFTLMTYLIVLGLIEVGLWIWMAKANGSGHKWARTVATVFGVINMLNVLVGGTEPGPTTTLSISDIASGVLTVVILYKLYRPDTKQYYDQYYDFKR